ncbi:MAG TPA: hypothetical protein VFA41_06480 [Ktedonobacteraceae bacterium]|jgi:hypothetical protein|nr:hypothetical protein [Ktedonobacteraceae bacterium]
MQNDSIETLLLRHYGSTAPAPDKLEETLVASIRLQAAQLDEEQQIARTLRERTFSRRRAVRMVALATAGIGTLSIGMDGLRKIESALLGQDITQPAYT